MHPALTFPLKPAAVVAVLLCGAWIWATERRRPALEVE